jgi:hypothetical protein
MIASVKQSNRPGKKTTPQPANFAEVNLQKDWSVGQMCEKGVNNSAKL